MDSSNSTLNVTAWSLRSSVHPEDKEMANECERILNEVVAKLKPILRYVCTPYEFFNMAGPGTKPHCLLVGTYNTQFSWDEGKPVHVFLNEQGKFFQAQKEAILMAKNDDHLVVLGPYENHRMIAFVEGAKPDPGGYDPWTQLVFSELIAKLRDVLVDAEEKRRQHLEAVTSRRETLDRMIEAMRPQSSATEEQRRGEISVRIFKSLLEDHLVRPFDFLLKVVKTHGIGVGPNNIGGILVERLSKETGISENELVEFLKYLTAKAVKAPNILGQPITTW